MSVSEIIGKTLYAIEEPDHCPVDDIIQICPDPSFFKGMIGVVYSVRLKDGVSATAHAEPGRIPKEMFESFDVVVAKSDDYTVAFVHLRCVVACNSKSVTACISAPPDPLEALVRAKKALLSASSVFRANFYPLKEECLREIREMKMYIQSLEEECMRAESPNPPFRQDAEVDWMNELPVVRAPLPE